MDVPLPLVQGCLRDETKTTRAAESDAERRIFFPTAITAGDEGDFNGSLSVISANLDA